MEFSTILRNLRKENNLTQEELAKIIGVSPGAIGLYEQGSRVPRNSIMKKIAEHFSVSIDYLLGFEVSTPVSHYSGKQTDEMTFDDFTIAMHNEIKDLTEEQKDALLNMAKALKSLNNK